ncbi:MAG TPA: rhodanese-like domain-containing protein [Gemmataceae bacterium]|nr:rhodanese-like domain-containing protein [Gemmataceae bacterium]
MPHDHTTSGPAERISPAEARRHMSKNGALLVCAYDSDEKFHQMHLEGAISLEQFKSRVNSLPKEREIIFYCG